MITSLCIMISLLVLGYFFLFFFQVSTLDRLNETRAEVDDLRSIVLAMIKERNEAHDPR